MKSNKIKLSKLDITLEIISLILMIVLFATTIITWGSAPDTIPTHFNSAGVVDGYGSKGMIFFMPIIMIGLYAMITLLSNYPEAYNYAVEITTSNKEKQYKMATVFMRLLKLELIGTFTYIQIATLRIINAGGGKMSAAFLPISLLILFGTVGVYIYKSARTK